MRKFLALLSGMLAAVIWGMSVKSQQRKAEIKTLQQEKQLAQQTAKQEQRQQVELTQLQQKHREEQINEQARIENGDRSQLDNDW